MSDTDVCNILNLVLTPISLNSKKELINRLVLSVPKQIVNVLATMIIKNELIVKYYIAAVLT